MTTTSFQIAFGDSATPGAHLSAELDAAADGLNGGQTNFSPGASAWFLVYRSDNVTISPPVASAGDIEGGQEFTVTRTQDLPFAATNTAALAVPAQEILNVVWIGRTLGALTLGTDRTAITAAATGVALARVTYRSVANAYRLTSPAAVAGLTDFPILIYIAGELTA